VRFGGLIAGYILTISCSRAAIVPNECHNIGAKSGTTSRFLLQSSTPITVYDKQFIDTISISS